MTRAPQRRLICALHGDFACALGDLDVRAARRVFADLMDRSLGAIHSARLDLDDVLLERVAAMRDPREAAQRVWLVPLDLLDKPEDWQAAFDRCRTATGMPAGPSASTEVVRLILRVYRERDVPRLDPFSPHGSQ